MSLLKNSEVEQILRTSKIGVWKIEISEGEEPRFYADAVMNELIGTTEEMSPEERFRFHRSHIHAEDAELFLHYAKRLTEENIEIVYRYLHPVKGEMYVRCGGKKQEEKDGHVILTGIHKDISDTIRMEKGGQAELRLAEQNSSLRRQRMMEKDYYKNLLDLQNCGVMAYTLPEHRLIHMNAEALRIYGFPSIDAIQKELGAVISQIYYPEKDTVEKLKNLRNTDDTVDYECIVNRGTDRECHIMAKTKVVVTPDGERTVVTTFLDISDMVMLKNALKAAEEGNRAKTRFLFNMSHDLRTPMNAILGYAELMEQHWDETENARDYLRKLKESGHLLLALINDVLEMARIENGKECLKEECCDVFRLKEVMEIIADAEAGRKGINFHRSMKADHVYVLCDELKLREIFLNLLSNAIKYTPAGGTVSMSTEEIPSGRAGYAVYRTVIEDSGCGIGKDYLPHIFEPFSREKSTSESGIKGTGLGLAIVKSLIEMMDGTICVESEQGKGTKVTIELSHKIVSGTEQKRSAEVSGEKLRGKRILLAEDNELNAEIAMTMLKDAGIETELATDGGQAVAMLSDAPVGYYDVILMDIQMPRMNGYEATGKIRSLPDERAGIPIIAMTANAFEEDRREALAAGMNEHIAKPIEIGKVLAVLERVLHREPEKYQEKRTTTMEHITREAAYELLKKYNKDPFHIQHALTVEAVMKWYAKELGFEADAEYWGIVGLLHDIDFELYPEQHCIKAPELLRAGGVGEDIIHSVVSHGYEITVDVAPEHEMEKVLFAADELTGLIWAAALMRPSKSTKDMELKSLKKKYKSKGFAAGCSREVIERGAEQLGWELDKLLTMTLEAMKATEDEINAEMEKEA